MLRIFLLVLLTFTLNALAVDWQGHRGARGLYPENTIGAMEEALKYPVTTLEFDVVLSKDNKVIVSHEPWMSAEICLDPEGKTIKDKQYNIFKMTYEDIQKFDCGTKSHPRFPRQKKIAEGKPTVDKLFVVIEDILKKLNRTEIQYNIEIKSTPEDEKEGFQPDIRTFSDVVLKTIRNHIPVSRFTIQSFDWRVLQYIHAAHPDVRLVALTEGSIDPEADLKKLGFNPYVFSPYFKFLKASHVDTFHKLGIKVVPWTVNEVSDMEDLINMNVDGIITDYPDLITEVGKKKCKKGENLFEGKCVKIPKNAEASTTIPGWTCKAGHFQKRFKCTKIKIPSNAHLTPDGKNWECDKGYERYRSRCKK